MGFFSKVFKGVGKVFKKIGKGIKSAFKKFGKFMNKIGILGQIAMWYFMPYAAAALGKMWAGVAGQTAAQAASTAAGAAATTAATTAGATATAAAAQGAAQAATTASTIAAGGSAATVALGSAQATGLMAGNAVARGVGHVMQFTANTVGKVGTVFNNITKGVTDTLGNFAKTASNNMFGTSFDAAANFFGPGDSAFGRSFGSESRFQNLTGSESVFENFKKDRIAETELKLNTKAGQKAMDRTVAESSSDWDSFEYDQKEFVNNSAYDSSITGGESNWTATTDLTSVPDSAALAKEVAIDPYGQESFARGMIDDAGTIVGGVNPTPPPSLLDRLKTGISEIPEAIYNKVGEIADDPLGYAGKGMEERFQSGVQTRLMQEAGIVEKPTYTQNYVTNAAYVPSFESFGGSQQQYGAPEIMNARAFEQQVTNNPSPYGYTAFQYGNYMAQYGQTA
jgi:hypothetical protein